jgi:hypothetical protein
MNWNSVLRHASYLLLIVIALTALVYIAEKQNAINTTVNVIASSIDEDSPNHSALNTMASLQAESYNSEPVKHFLYGIIAITLAIPLTGLVLFTLTKAPFLKMIVLGKDGELDKEERLMAFVVLSFVYIGNCYILGCAIGLTGAL